MPKLPSLIVPSLIACLGIAGCTSLANQSEMNELAEKRAATLTQDAASLKASLDKKMTERSLELMPFYAPLHWKLARESFEKASEMMAKNAPDADVKKQLLIVEQCISAMPKTKTTILKEMADVAEYFKYLQKIEADQAYPETYAKLIADVRSINEKFDIPDADAAGKAKTKLLEELKELEIETVIFQQTSLASLALENAEEKDADETAEASFEHAEKAIAVAISTIRKNPRNYTAIDEAGRTAFIEARHAGAIGEEVRTMQEALDSDDISPEALEGVILRFESSLTRISKGLGVEEIRYLPLTDQADLLTTHAVALASGTKLVQESINHVNRDYPPVTVDSALLWLPPEFSRN